MNFNSIRSVLVSECGPFISELKKCAQGSILVRGFFGEINVIRRFDHNIENRVPLHTSQDVHDMVNDLYLDQFGWKIRNGAFCFGFNLRSQEKPRELGYGPFYICFPIGDFDFVYSPTIIDMFGHIRTTREPIEQVIRAFDFTNDSLCNAIYSGERKYQNVSNEISVRTKSYYLIDYSYRDWIDRIVWS